MAETLLIQDSVGLNLSVEDTIKSDNATLTVTVEMVLHEKTSEQAQTEITTGLNGVVVGEWEVINIHKYNDSSGLEKWNVAAKIRVPEKSLSDLSNKCRAVSKPGLQFKVKNVDYTPTTNEYEGFYQILRRQLYAKINEEIALLKEMTSRVYRISSLNFRTVTETNQSQVETTSPFNVVKHYSGNANQVQAFACAAPGSPMGSGGGNVEVTEDDQDDSSGFSVSQKVTMTANVNLLTVSLASVPSNSTLEWF